MILKLEFEIFYAEFFLFINFILFIVNIGENIADSKTKLVFIFFKANFHSNICKIYGFFIS